MPAGFSWASAAADPGPAATRFEDDRVRMTLAAFGLAALRFELLDAHAERHGRRRLTFAGLRGRLPTFPALLEARHVGGASSEVRRADLFRLFDRSSLEDRYLEVFARHADEAGGRPVGLVLPFGGLRSGLVIHNADFETGGDRLTHPVSTGAAPHRLTAEPFKQFLRFLAAGGWYPDAPAARKCGVESAPALEAKVASWMMERLGTGPAACVLGFLRAVLDSPQPQHRAWVRRLEGGERCVCMPQEDMAAAFGMPPAVLKRGLSRLREQGVVETFTRERRTCVLLLPGRVSCPLGARSD
jgi:hypothetical protein